MTRTRPAPGVQSQDPPWEKILHVADQVRNSLTIDDHILALSRLQDLEAHSAEKSGEQVQEAGVEA